MFKQYDILTKCLSLYKKSGYFRQTQDLNLECELLDAKILLLNKEIYSLIEGDTGSEAEFESLYRDLNDMIAFSAETADIDKLCKRLRDVVEPLREHLKYQSAAQ
jgi:hypothetical protein